MIRYRFMLQLITPLFFSFPCFGQAPGIIGELELGTDILVEPPASSESETSTDPFESTDSDIGNQGDLPFTEDELNHALRELYKEEQEQSKHTDTEEEFVLPIVGYAELFLEVPFQSQVSISTKEAPKEYYLKQQGRRRSVLVPIRTSGLTTVSISVSLPDALPSDAVPEPYQTFMTMKSLDRRHISISRSDIVERLDHRRLASVLAVAVDPSKVQNLFSMGPPAASMVDKAGWSMDSSFGMLSEDLPPICLAPGEVLVNEAVIVPEESETHGADAETPMPEVHPDHSEPVSDGGGGAEEEHEPTS
ncbi:MAG: hypothetical protein KDB27_32705 [Planctomycetales bacterium]|nr:hypothetical protein [Planctomycetales bacterium]